jgi:hypothetical protein
MFHFLGRKEFDGDSEPTLEIHIGLEDFHLLVRRGQEKIADLSKVEIDTGDLFEAVPGF